MEPVLPRLSLLAADQATWQSRNILALTLARLMPQASFAFKGMQIQHVAACDIWAA